MLYCCEDGWGIVECCMRAMASFQKHPSFGDLVHKFSQAYMLRPGAVKGFDATEPSEFGIGTKEHPKDAEDQLYSLHRDHKEGAQESLHESESGPSEESEKLSRKVQALESLLNDTFATISALKSAYIKLQAAHSPYDFERLRIADKAVIAELKRLSELKHSYREKHSNVSLTHRTFTKSSPEDGEEDTAKKLRRLENALMQQQKLFNAYEGYVENNRREIEEKNAEIKLLKASFGTLTAKKDELEKRVRKLEHKPSKDQTLSRFASKNSTVSQVFEQAVQEAQYGASKFVKMLISLMKSAHWDIDAAASAIEPAVVYSLSAHKKYAFESYVCRRMYSGFENENFYMNGSLSSILDPEKHRHECLLQFQEMSLIDPLEIVSITPDSLFGKFCHKKYLQIVHEKMEESFFGNFHHRHQILDGAHPRSRFYQSFIKLAKAVWLVHKLAFSVSPIVKIFQVKKDVNFYPLYMESVTNHGDLEDHDTDLRQKVALTVTPGFCINDDILKCRVYLQDMLPGVCN